jgi:DNA-binding NtrC family response regulator
MLKVAVIDGNAISRDLLSTILLNGGYEVIGGSNASPAGIAKIVKLAPQLVCIDIGQSDAQGWEALDSLKAGLPKALVFMVSGRFDADTIKTAAARGVLGFIVKPFNADTVLETIRKSVIKLARKHQSASDEPPA